METIYAIIESGVVTNCIVADDWPDGINITHLAPRPGIGWSYDGETFIAPEAPVPESVPLEPLTKLEFLRRFTGEERIAARVLAKTDLVIEDAQHLLDLAQDVRLDDPDTVAYVGYLEHVGVLAAGRAAVILSE